VPDLVVAYDPAWPERYDSEAERLRETLGAIVVEIEHVGSTAVPGIAAKPTIDIAVGVRRIQDIGSAQIAAMEELDYVYRGEAGVPGRHEGSRWSRPDLLLGTQAFLRGSDARAGAG